MSLRLKQLEGRGLMEGSENSVTFLSHRDSLQDASGSPRVNRIYQAKKIISVQSEANVDSNNSNKKST